MSLLRLVAILEGKKSRGQQPGATCHGRTSLPRLPGRVEIVGLDDARCPQCGQALQDFPGTEHCEVVEIEVQAYRRVIRRRRYRPPCNCGCMPGIVTAPSPPRLIERGKFGISVWVSVLLDEYLYGRPSHRLLQDLADHGLTMSPGTLMGGLQAIAALFEPLEQVLVTKLRSEPHWHADETRWAVFAVVEGKAGHRWTLWVFHSSSVIHYVLDETRSAEVVEAELAGVHEGIISCERYSAYKKFARLHPMVILAFSWAYPCYKAANWTHVGQTTGRGNKSRVHHQIIPIKDVWLYPLRKDFADLFCRQAGGYGFAECLLPSAPPGTARQGLVGGPYREVAAALVAA